MTIRVGVFGATGYTGLETVKLIRNHPQVSLAFATSETYSGQHLSDVYPVPWQVPLINSEAADLNEVEAVFCCLPHAASIPTVSRARGAGVRVIDLSADFRLKDVQTYESWYNTPHTAPEYLPEAVYGLPEVYRQQIRETDLLAVPGCYPTSILLGLYPLVKANWLQPGAPIIADSKSGVSGAGRKLSLTTHFVEANENLSPYNIGQKHRHTAEIFQALTAWQAIYSGQVNGQQTNPADTFIFAPHLVPISRGMLSTIYVQLAADHPAAAAQTLFEETYADSPLVWTLPAGQLAGFAHTQNTNLCALSVTWVNPRQLIICASIDNLGKGASGQAVQCFNLMFGLDEASGLL